MIVQIEKKNGQFGIVITDEYYATIRDILIVFSRHEFKPVVVQT